MTTNIIIIDNRELFREGLRSLINESDTLRVVQSSSIMNYKEQYRKGNVIADIIIFSADETCDSFNLYCSEINAFFNRTPLIVLASSYTKRSIMESIESGIVAFYSKSISPDKLKQLIYEIQRKNGFTDIKLDTNVRNVLINNDEANELFTNAETEVIRLVCQQKSSAEISEDLGISVRTVESRKRNMMQKTNSKNIIGVVLEYLKYYQKVD